MRRARSRRVIVCARASTRTRRRSAIAGPVDPSAAKDRRYRAAIARELGPRLPRGKSAFVSHVHCGASFKTSSHPRGGQPIGRGAPRARDRGRPIGAAGFEILWSLFTGQLVSTNVASVPSRGTRVGVRLYMVAAPKIRLRLGAVNICVKVLADADGTV